jgi:hypothetical protein
MNHPSLIAAADERAPHSLSEALHSGPFDAALRLAIADRGLSLESLQRRLQADGFTVSLSALSYWQRGLRRPERVKSLRAVRAIERILGLRRASLMALLGPPRPRGRWCDRSVEALRFEDMWGSEPGLETVLDGLDTSVNADFRHVSMQGERWMGPDRTWFADRHRRTVAASADGIDRFVAIKRSDAPNGRPSRLQPLTGCRLGRLHTDPQSGLQAAELLFDLPLLAGQAHVFEYQYRPRKGTHGITEYVISSRHWLRELVLRVHFHPSATPVRCYHVRRDHHDDPFREFGEVPVPASGTANIVSLDVPPGVEGFRWEWE